MKGLKEFPHYYNNRRTHQNLDRKTPYDWYEYAAQDLNLKNIPCG